MNQDRLNAAWVDAPYRVDFLFAVPRCPRKNWSRKRRLKWIRRRTKQLLKSFRPPPVHNFNLRDMIGDEEIAAMTELTYCAACRGDVTEPHTCGN